MAQKASPYAIRLGYNQFWNSYFFPESGQGNIDWLKRDKSIRDYFHSVFPDTTRLKIEYTRNNIFVYLYIPEVSLVLGENNEKLEKVVKDVYAIINDEKVVVKINLIEVKKVYTQAQAVANLIVGQLKKRLRSRLVLRNILFKLSSEREVRGVKILVNGRLDGAENTQRKKYIQKKTPFSTIDSNIEPGEAKVIMSYGVIGVKVLIYKGKIWRKKNHVNTEKN